MRMVTTFKIKWNGVVLWSLSSHSAFTSTPAFIRRRTFFKVGKFVNCFIASWRLCFSICCSTPAFRQCSNTSYPNLPLESRWSHSNTMRKKSPLPLSQSRHLFRRRFLPLFSANNSNPTKDQRHGILLLLANLNNEHHISSSILVPPSSNILAISGSVWEQSRPARNTLVPYIYMLHRNSSCSGVHPMLSQELGSLPCCSKSSTNSGLPVCTARWSGNWKNSRDPPLTFHRKLAFELWFCINSFPTNGTLFWRTAQ